ncbi:fungal-specific transcription factor domain-containing protein [Choanephora cucurbitarum]|nr:fungal-specific transcription factor domain-containing protein [Choanephora cucurbitarum]
MAVNPSPQPSPKRKQAPSLYNERVQSRNERSQSINKNNIEQTEKDEDQELMIELSSIGSGHHVRYIGDMSPLPLLAQTVNFDDARIASQVGFKIKRFGQSLVILQKDDSANRPDSQRVLERLGKLRPGESIRGINDWIFKVTGLDKKTSDTLMKIYFAYIHPSLPVLNKQLFLKQYRSQISEYPSAPLLNAIYGASVRYIETCKIFGDDLFLDHSITTKENLSETLFQNVLVYFRGKYNPCISLVQASLISQNHRASMDEKMTSKWALVSVAARVAQDLGLHRSSDSWSLPVSEKETRKRTWAAVYITDKWSAASTGRPQTIFDEDCDEFYPSESADWDEVMDVPQEGEDENDGPRFPSLDEHVARKVKRGIIPLYQPFVQLLKLSEILGKLLQGLYTPLAKKHSEKYGSDAIVNYLDNALSEWRSALPPALQICSTNVHRLNNHGLTPLISMSAIMYMAYCTLLILLHRPFIEKNGEQKTRSSQSSLSICTSAATQCVAIAEKMHYRDFLLVAWNFAVYPVFTATLIHVNSASNPDPNVSDTAKSNLIRARKLLERLSRMSFAATQLHGIVDQLIMNRDITFDKLIKCDGRNPYELPSDRERKRHKKAKKSNELTVTTLDDTTIPSQERSDLRVDVLGWSDSDAPASSHSTPSSSVNGDWINGLYSVDMNHVEALPYSLRQFGFNTSATSSYQQAPMSYQQPNSGASNGNEFVMPTNPIDSILLGLSNHLNNSDALSSQSQPPLNNLMDNNSIFRNRPDNPFWSVPSTIEMDDWMAYLLQPQQSQSEQTCWQDTSNGSWV